MEKLYDVKQVAEQLGVSVHAVRKWILDGKISNRKVGKFVRFSQADIDAFVVQRNSSAGGDTV